MRPRYTFAAVTADPACLSAQIQAPDGTRVTFRPLLPGDAGILGSYFLGLSDDTKNRYGPHPFDQATADRLCAEIDYSAAIRMIAVHSSPAGEEVVAYFILQPGIPTGEQERYGRTPGRTAGWARR
jgi:hypothetical protein